MISAHLTRDFKIGRLYNSYLIQADDIDLALADIYKFLGENIFDGNQAISHTDLSVVRKQDTSSKNISVDQIRQLQLFINKTSIISGYKVGIIAEADLMNVNAANSCLKMLEDTPNHGLVILLTNNMAAILPTIRSRCNKITHYFNPQTNSPINAEILKQLADNSYDVKINLLKEFSGKDRQKWLEFALTIERLLAKFVKCSTRAILDLTLEENIIYQRLKSKSYNSIHAKLEKVSCIIKQTIELDLDLRSNTLILMSVL